MHRARLTTLACVALAACQPQGEIPPSAESSRSTERPVAVATVNYPLAYFAERIGGDVVSVALPVPADEDPALWSPGPEAIATYQAADLILLNGADYAKWVARVSLPQSKLVDTGRSFSDRLIPLTDTVTHTHGPAGEHAHAGVAFTTWLDFELAREHARSVAKALEQARPGQRARFNSRLAQLEAEIGELDGRLLAAAESIGDRPVLFSHPVYQYFERRYSLNGRSVHWEPDAEPSARQWRELEKLLREHPAKWMVWEAEASGAVVERLRDLGVESIVFDPAANRAPDGDFLSRMNSNADRLDRAWHAR